MTTMRFPREGERARIDKREEKLLQIGREKEPLCSDFVPIVTSRKSAECVSFSLLHPPLALLDTEFALYPGGGKKSASLAHIQQVRWGGREKNEENVH